MAVKLTVERIMAALNIDETTAKAIVELQDQRRPAGKAYTVTLTDEQLAELKEEHPEIEFARKVYYKSKKAKETKEKAAPAADPQLPL